MKQDIDEQTFETPVRAPKPDGAQEKALTAAARLCRESWIVPNSAWASLLLDGKAGAGSKLAKQMKRAYAEMSAEPAMKRLLNERTLGRALRARSSDQGHYYCRHVPDSPVVVFLHGYGGNFLFYIWMLKRLLPACTLVHPSCGIDWLKRSAAKTHSALPIFWMICNAKPAPIWPTSGWQAYPMEEGLHLTSQHNVRSVFEDSSALPPHPTFKR